LQVKPFQQLCRKQELFCVSRQISFRCCSPYSSNDQLTLFCVLFARVWRQARAAHKEAQGSRQMGRARNAMEDAFARAAAGGGAITLRSANKRPAAGQPGDGNCTASAVMFAVMFKMVLRCEFLVTPAR
jgi:hypothetical protein